MLTVIPTNRFRKDVARVAKRGKDMNKLKILIELLVNEEPLPTAYLAHPLKGDKRPFWDAHIEPDWLLIYKVRDDELHLARTGSHADLFAK